MRNPGKILLSFMLSLMLVYLGTGIAILRCCHNDVYLAQQTNKECCGGHHGAHHPCGKVTVLKLSPTIKAQPASTQLPDMASGLPVFLHLSLHQQLRIPHPAQSYYRGEALSPTPREYLARLHILRI